jgi:hypothetical protein
VLKNIWSCWCPRRTNSCNDGARCPDHVYEKPPAPKENEMSYCGHWIVVQTCLFCKCELKESKTNPGYLYCPKCDDLYGPPATNMQIASNGVEVENLDDDDEPLDQSIVDTLGELYRKHHPEDD